jgi:hypothetical protein
MSTIVVPVWCGTTLYQRIAALRSHGISIMLSLSAEVFYQHQLAFHMTSAPRTVPAVIVPDD